MAVAQFPTVVAPWQSIVTGCFHPALLSVGPGTIDGVDLSQGTIRRCMQAQKHSGALVGAKSAEKLRRCALVMLSSVGPNCGFVQLNGHGVPGSVFHSEVLRHVSCQGRLGFNGDKDIKPRTLADLIEVYHGTVGRNCVLELDFAINRDGLVEPSHAARYAELGAWIRSCYSKPIAATNGTMSSAAPLVLTLPQPALVDRIVVQEKLELGQRIRNFTIESQARSGAPWLPFGSGESVGHKRILLLENRTVVALRLRVVARIAPALAPVSQTSRVMPRCSACRSFGHAAMANSSQSVLLPRCLSPQPPAEDRDRYTVVACCFVLFHRVHYLMQYYV